MSIGAAAKALGVSITTLRRWEADGRLAAEHTAGGHRRYDLAKLRPELFHAEEAANRRTIAYARVSSHDQKDALERQKQVLERYCTRQGWTFEIIADLGSGMNYHKKGLKRLLDAVLEGHIGRLVMTHKDRLLRFGAELVFAICEAKGVEIVILNHGDASPSRKTLPRMYWKSSLSFPPGSMAVARAKTRSCWRVCEPSWRNRNANRPSHRT